jgi:hypothetical protein
VPSRDAQGCPGHTGVPREPVSNIYTAINGAPSARRAARHWPGSRRGRGRTWGAALDDREVPRRRWLRWRGSRRRGAAAWPAASAWGRTARAAAAAPLPPHPPPARPPAVTQSPVSAPARAPSRSPAPGILSPRKLPVKALRPAAFASLRFAPGRPLTASFPGKNWHLPGGRESRAGIPLPVVAIV